MSILGYLGGLVICTRVSDHLSENSGGGGSEDFLKGGGRDPPAKLNLYWSIFTGVCFVGSSMLPV